MLSGYISPLLAACVLPLLAPVQGSGRDYCRSPLPCTEARRGNPPGPPAREQGGRRATSRIASARSAPSLLPRSRPAPQGASQLYVFLLLAPLFFPCSLLACCPACPPPCAQGQHGRWPFFPCAHGGVPAGQSPRPAPRGSREAAGRPAALRLPALHPPCSLAPVRPPPGGLPISILFSIWLIFH